MFGIELTQYDRTVYENQIADFLPEKMIDSHIHIWKQEMERKSADARKGCVSWPRLVAPDCTVEDLLESYRQLCPGKTIRPVLMTTPTANLDAANPYALECGKKYGLPVLYCTRYDTPPEEIEKKIKYEGYCGIKPYQNNSDPVIPAKELRIFDFLPPEHLDVIDALGATVILHIARDGRLRDPLNLKQMMEIDRRWPHAKVIIAHIGRAYSPEDLVGAFDILKNSRNLFFDIAATTHTEAMVECLQNVGTDRLLFGTDMPITKMRMYRISENGCYINVVPRGLYGDVSADIHMRETDETQITTFFYEELLALKRCAEQLHLSRAQIERIFYGNAADIFDMHF